MSRCSCHYSSWDTKCPTYLADRAGKEIETPLAQWASTFQCSVAATRIVLAQ